MDWLSHKLGLQLLKEEIVANRKTCLVRNMDDAVYRDGALHGLRLTRRVNTAEDFSTIVALREARARHQDIAYRLGLRSLESCVRYNAATQEMRLVGQCLVALTVPNQSALEVPGYVQGYVKQMFADRPHHLRAVAYDTIS